MIKRGEDIPVSREQAQDANTRDEDLAKFIGDRVTALVGDAMTSMQDGSRAQHFVDRAVSQIIADNPSKSNVASSDESVNNNSDGSATAFSKKGDGENDSSLKNPPQNVSNQHEQPYLNVYGEPSDRPKSARLNNTEKIVLNCVKNIAPEADLSEFEEFDHLVATNAIKKAIIKEVLEKLDLSKLLDASAGKKKQRELQFREIALDEKERWLIAREKELDEKFSNASPEDQVAELRKKIEEEQAKLDAKIRELDPWAGALHRWETVLKARNEEVISVEARLKDRTEALERDTKIRQAEVRAEFSRCEQEATRREDLSTKLKEMTTAFKSKELFATQQKESYESQLAGMEGTLLKVKEELAVMKMRESELMRYIASQNDRLQEVSLAAALTIPQSRQSASPYVQNQCGPPTANSFRKSPRRPGSRLPPLGHQRHQHSTPARRMRNESPLEDRMGMSYRGYDHYEENHMMPLTYLRHRQEHRHMLRTPNF